MAIVAGVGTVAAASADKPGPSPIAGYTKDQCKDGGWQDFKNADGTPMFKNQGECVAFFASGGKGGNASSNENNTTQSATVNQNVTSGPADNGAASGSVSASAATSMSSSTTSTTNN